ncbi:unnamed protein product, partial [Ectocarpus sp. 12 AP-2014]
MPTKSDLETEVEQLKTQLAELRTQSDEVANTLKERVSGYVGQAVESGSHRAQHALD